MRLLVLLRQNFFIRTSIENLNGLVNVIAISPENRKIIVSRLFLVTDVDILDPAVILIIERFCFQESVRPPASASHTWTSSYAMSPNKAAFRDGTTSTVAWSDSPAEEFLVQTLLRQEQDRLLV